MGFALGPIATAAGYRLAAYDTIGSTSTEAMERARRGEPGRLWVVARAQTAGYGRRGRAWATPPGNLAASLLLKPECSDARSATLGFVAGLALRDAIEAVSPPLGGSRLRLKWPNDVLLDGAKVAGILLQAMSAPGGSNSVVIGIGVNIVSAPENLSYPATSLATAGSAAAAEAIFGTLAESWVDHESAWDDGRGFAAIRSRWLDHAEGTGGPIAVRSGDMISQGIFETIDDAGRMVLRSQDGAAHLIAAGDVHFGGAATTAVA